MGNVSRKEIVEQRELLKEELEKWYDAQEKLINGRHNSQNQEVIDPRPMSMAIRYERPPTLEEQVQQFLNSQSIRELAESEGVETFDESEDFEVESDPDPLEQFFDSPTPWEESGNETFEDTAERIRRDVDKKIADYKKARKAADDEKAELERLRKASKKGANAPSDEE